MEKGLIYHLRNKLLARHWYVILLLVIVSSSCNQVVEKKNPTEETKKPIQEKYFWIRYMNLVHQRIDTLDILKFTKLELEYTTSFWYESEVDTTKAHYFSKADSATFSGHFYHSIQTRFLKDTTIFQANDTEVVKMFLTKSDHFGGIITYLSPKYGILAARPIFSGTIVRLASNNKKTDERIRSLIKATVPKDFLKGQLLQDLQQSPRN